MPRTAAPQPSDGRGTPAERVRALVAAAGAVETARWCADLLVGRLGPDEPWLASLAQLPPQDWLHDPVNAYWLRVWGARGLLHNWPEPPESAVVRTLVEAFADPAWRVREMAAKVVARHQVGEAADALLPLAADTVPRVRAAAVRALAGVGEAEHVDAVLEARADPDLAVRQAAERAIPRLEQRLDRPL